MESCEWIPIQEEYEKEEEKQDKFEGYFKNKSYKKTK